MECDDFSLEPARVENELYLLHTERMRDLNSIPDYDPSFSKSFPPPLAVLYVSTMVSPLRRMYSWAVPSRAALNLVAKTSPNGVVEIGAGSGYWAGLLRANGVPTLAVDILPPALEGHNGHHSLDFGAGHRQNVPPFTTVETGGVEVAAKHPDKTLFLCWPPPEDQDEGLHGGEQQNMALESLNAYRGNTVVYVGGREGSTAGEKFHSQLKEEWNLRHQLALPRWPSATDSLQVWSRRQQHLAQHGSLCLSQC